MRDGELVHLAHEVADLRRAIEELSERLDLRQLRASLEDVSGQVMALQRAVMESPGLEQLAEDVAALRTELVTLRRPPGAAGTDPAVLAALEGLRTSISQLTSGGEPVVALTPVLDELRELRQEVVALRRRVALRTQADEPVSDERLAELLEAVLEQRAGGRGRPRRRR